MYIPTEALKVQAEIPRRLKFLLQTGNINIEINYSSKFQVRTPSKFDGMVSVQKKTDKLRWKHQRNLHDN